MASARGDTKPCTHAACAGTMQFGREPARQVTSAMAGDGARGWVCSEEPSHFRLASEREWGGAPAPSAPRARWEDDGGSTAKKLATGSRS